MSEIVGQAVLHIEEGEITRLVHGAFLQRQNSRVGRDALEQLQVAKIHHAFHRHVIGEESAQVLARSRAEESGGGDIAQSAAVLEQPDALLEEIGVKVRPVGSDLVMLFQIRLLRLDEFHPHIRRIAQHNIEAAVFEHLRKGSSPVEGPVRIGLVRDQAVACLDRVFEVLQFVLTPGCLEP